MKRICHSPNLVVPHFSSDNNVQFPSGNLPRKVAHNRPHDARLAHLYFRVGSSDSRRRRRLLENSAVDGGGNGRPDVRVTAGNLRIFYENVPEVEAEEVRDTQCV